MWQEYIDERNRKKKKRQLIILCVCIKKRKPTETEKKRETLLHLTQWFACPILFPYSFDGVSHQMLRFYK
jgi:hypothetical protein